MSISESDAIRYIEKYFYRVRYSSIEMNKVVSGRKLSFDGVVDEYNVI